MLLPSQDCLDFFPEYRSTQIAWQGLMPFGAWLIRTVGPARVVELGSYRGDSLFCFQQAAQGLTSVKDICGIDCWSGDHHTGPYGEEVYSQFMTEFERRADPRLRALRTTFADAAQQFEDGAIDLLHIDGAHDYDSVRADYETWLPKMATDGIILFHDTMVKTDDFGVHRLWDEISAAAPGRCINLGHSNGLGVLCLGTAERHAIHRLCASPEHEAKTTELALKLAGDRIVTLSRYEYGFVTRTGGKVPDSHVFARGADLESIRTLWSIEVDLREIPQPAPPPPAPIVEPLSAERLVGLLAEQGPALFQLVEQDLAFALRRAQGDLARSAADAMDLRAQEILQELSERIPPLVTEAALVEAQNRFNVLQANMEKERTETVHRLLDEVKGLVKSLRDELLAADGEAVFSALAPRLGNETDTRITTLLPEQLPKAYSHIEALVKTTNKLKNDAQDDAIIGLAAKVEAQDQAIVSLVGELKSIHEHPLFRAGR